MKHDKSHTTVSDSEDNLLRRALKSDLMQAPPNPWFTRKVMNRLPEKKVHVAARIEYLVYALAAISIAVSMVFYWISAWRSGGITVRDFGVTFIAACAFSSIVALAVTPFLEARQ